MSYQRMSYKSDYAIKQEMHQKMNRPKKTDLLFERIYKDFENKRVNLASDRS